jgi:hypothetical protein
MLALAAIELRHLILTRRGISLATRTATPIESMAARKHRRSGFTDSAPLTQ